MTEKFKVGDFVWAKMKGYPPWPAEVVNHPSGRTKAKQHYVIFFGSKQFAWIADQHIFPYVENIETLSKKCRHRGYQEAIIGIEKAYKEYLLQSKKSGKSGTNSKKVASESVENEQSSTSDSNDEDEEIISVQGNEYVNRKKRKRTPEEMEERQRLINKRLRVKAFPKNKKTTKKVVKKKLSSNKDSVVTVKVEDYKQIITKEAVILLERCDREM